MGKLNKEDLLALKFWRTRKKQLKGFFLASKTGRNARGKGAERSVVLGTYDGETWFQAQKFWGRDDETRAKEFIEQFNNPL